MSIYVLRYGDLLKIGYSSNLPARVNHIMAAIPGHVTFVGHMPGDREVERHFHEKFSTSRFQGEWFASTPELEQFCILALANELPEHRRTVPKALRAASDDEWSRASSLFRKMAASRWPQQNHQERKALLVEQLGWTPRRVRSLYEAQPGCRLHNSEMQQLSKAYTAAARLIEPTETPTKGEE